MYAMYTCMYFVYVCIHVCILYMYVSLQKKFKKKSPQKQQSLYTCIGLVEITHLLRFRITHLLRFTMSVLVSSRCVFRVNRRRMHACHMRRRIHA